MLNILPAPCNTILPKPHTHLLTPTCSHPPAHTHLLIYQLFTYPCSHTKFSHTNSSYTHLLTYNSSYTNSSHTHLLTYHLLTYPPAHIPTWSPGTLLLGSETLANRRSHWRSLPPPWRQSDSGCFEWCQSMQKRWH